MYRPKEVKEVEIFLMSRFTLAKDNEYPCFSCLVIDILLYFLFWYHPIQKLTHHVVSSSTNRTSLCRIKFNELASWRSKNAANCPYRTFCFQTVLCDVIEMNQKALKYKKNKFPNFIFSLHYPLSFIMLVWKVMKIQYWYLIIN